MLGERVGADEALRIGLVSSVIDDDALHDRVRRDRRPVGGDAAHRGPLMKQNLDDTVTLPLHEYLDAETERFAQCSGSEESIAAAKAFLAQS